MYRQGVMGTGGDADGDESTIPTLEFMGNHNHTRGGQPTPSTVTTVRHYSAMYALNGQHVTTAQCFKVAEQKRWWLAEQEMRESMERAFQSYGKPLATFTLFKYLGRVLMVADEYWQAVVGNLWKV